MQFVDVVIDSRAIAVSFLGDDVNDDRFAKFLGARQHLFEGGLVMPVDQSGVFDPEAFEDGGRLEQLLQALFDPIGGLVGRRPDERKVAQQPGDLVLDALIARIDS